MASHSSLNSSTRHTLINPTCGGSRRQVIHPTNRIKVCQMTQISFVPSWSVPILYSYAWNTHTRHINCMAKCQVQSREETKERRIY
jgi:hypothetical protein